MTKIPILASRGRHVAPSVPVFSSPLPPIVGDTDNPYVEQRLLTDLDVQCIWNMNNPAGALATIGGAAAAAHDNADAGGSSLANIRFFEPAPAPINGQDIGNCERLVFPVPGVDGSTQTNSLTYGEFCRRRHTEFGLASFRDLYFRYYVYLPAGWNCYSGGKLPALVSIPASAPLSHLSSSNDYFDDSWYAGIMWNPPSSQLSFGGGYSGDSNLDHIRVQCYVYCWEIRSSTGALVWSHTQVPTDGHGFQVKARSGLNQDESVLNAGTAAAVTGTGSNIYLRRGQWNLIEQHVVINDEGVANGRYVLWVNEELALHIPYMKWAADANNASAIINTTQFNTFFGGPFGAASTQTMWKGEYVWSSAYIGPRAA